MAEPLRNPTRFDNWFYYHITDKAQFLDFLTSVAEINERPGSDYDSIADDAFPISVVLEDNYIDRDWTSMLEAHYCRLLSNHQRRCRRFHLFSDKKQNICGISQLINPDLVKEEDYLGYFTVYENWPKMRGRTYLSPHFLGVTGKVCSCRHQAHIFGRKFTLNSFPSISQDVRFISCAHASLWGIMRYYSEKYKEYPELNPSYVVERAGMVIRQGRNIPTGGLNNEQISQVLSQFSLPPAFHGVDEEASESEKKREKKKLLELIKGYLMSGLPVLIGAITKNEQDEKEGHALIGMGLTGEPKYSTPGVPISGSGHSIMNLANRDIICMDDNAFPYGVISAPPFRTRISPDAIEEAWIPLHEKVMFEWESAKLAVARVLNDHCHGVKAMTERGFFPSQANPDLVVRLFLASSKTYREFLMTKQRNNPTARMITAQVMPRFIWVAECRVQQKSEISVEILFDATAANHDPLSHIVVRYPGFLGISDRSKSRGNKPLTQYFETNHLDGNRTQFPGNLPCIGL